MPLRLCAAPLRHPGKCGRARALEDTAVGRRRPGSTISEAVRQLGSRVAWRVRRLGVGAGSGRGSFVRVGGSVGAHSAVPHRGAPPRAARGRARLSLCLRHRGSAALEGAACHSENVEGGSHVSHMCLDRDTVRPLPQYKFDRYTL